MSDALMTTWSEYAGAVQRVLSLAERELKIFDADLARLRFEQPENAALLQRFLAADRANRLRIVVRDAAPLRNASPRLWRLLTLHPASMTVVTCAASLAGLSDSLLIADARHAVVRFHDDHARSKALIDAPLDCAPYARRFDEILAEGGEELGATTLGL